MCSNGFAVCPIGFGKTIRGDIEVTCSDCPFRPWCESCFVRGEVVLAEPRLARRFGGVDDLETALLAIADGQDVQVSNLADWGEPMLRVEIS